MKYTIFILLIFICSCSPTVATKKKTTSSTIKSNPNYIPVKYEETSCKPSWVVINDDSKTIQNLKEFLESKGIIIVNPIIKGEKFDMICMACSCKTGRVFQFLIHKKDLLKANNEGFTKL